MDRHRLAGARGLIEQVGEKRISEPSAAMRGQQRNVDDAVLGSPARQIQPADRYSSALDDEEVGALIVLLVMAVLRIELRPQERGFLRVRPIRYGELLHARGSVEARQERQVGVGDGAKREARGGGARPAKGWRSFLAVMPGLVPGIHAFRIWQHESRGWPGQAR